MTKQRTVSLVLGSGGARGMAHIGVIRWLEEHNYQIESIVGCSTGALVGGIYAAGKLDEFEEWARAITKVEIVKLLDLAWMRTGFIKGDKIINTLTELVGDIVIEDLPLKYTAVAADIEHEREVWLNSGRLFDAVTAITNICTVSKFHAEAPMRLESAAHHDMIFSYPFDFEEQISFKSTIKAILDDLHFNIPVSEISAKFHNTFINVIFAVASQIRKTKGITKVVLSGGTFQNKYVLGRIEKLLEKGNFEVYAHTKVPSNDAGIALGQMVVAAKKRELGLV